MKRFCLLLVLLVGLCPGRAVAAGPLDELAGRVVAAATQRLAALTRAEAGAIACLTNAGYVSWQGRGTAALCDALSALAPVSIGRGNLLAVHSANDQPLFFAWVHRASPTSLALVLVRAAPDGSVTVDGPVDVYVGVGTDLKPMQQILGERAFQLVTLANGWADRVPEDIFSAALFHDHLCCGVFTGHFTVAFIRRHLPLEPGQHLIYIGAPAWCQDDYIIRVLNLTPGKHGYVKMDYPWSRPWQTSSGTYDRLGGIVVRWDPNANRGLALVLRFDWQEEAFRSFVNKPDLTLDWRNQPWSCWDRTRTGIDRSAGANL